MRAAASAVLRGWTVCQLGMEARTNQFYAHGWYALPSPVCLDSLKTHGWGMQVNMEVSFQL
jgi:hypothetical protein